MNRNSPHDNVHSHLELNWNQNACIFESAVTVTATGAAAGAAATAGSCIADGAAIWPLETNSRDLIALFV